MKKKIIFVLVYNEWDGGGGDITENVIASSSMDTIVAYKMDLEEKSAILQNQILELEQQRDEKVKPIWEKLHPIIQDLRQSNAIKMDPKYRSDLVAERDKLNEASGALHQEFYKKKLMNLSAQTKQFPPMSELLLPQTAILPRSSQKESFVFCI